MSKQMPIIGIIYSILLIGLGPLFYSLADQKSLTIFIPTLLGVIALIGALFALKEKYLKQGMHVVVFISLLGTGAGAKSTYLACYGVIVSLFNNSLFLRLLPLSDKEKALLGLISLMMLLLSINSFIEARKQKKSNYKKNKNSISD